MALTDMACKNAKSRIKAYKMTDANGLYLYIKPNGSKLWRFKYHFSRKEKLLALGVYPTMSLLEARDARENAKELLSQSIDPSDEKRIARRLATFNKEGTFEEVALEYAEKQKGAWSAKHHLRFILRLKTDVFPTIGKDNIARLEAPDILVMLRKLENRNAIEMANRTRQKCNQIFRYAIQTGRRTTNPVEHLRGALKTKKTEHFACIEPHEIPRLITDIERNDARMFLRTKRAIKFSMLTFARPGEVRTAEWQEIDFKKKEWRISAEKMKSRRPHIVPLSTQAIAILEEQKQETGHFNTAYVFPNKHHPQKPMSDGAVNLAMQNLGYQGKMTAHGFRALARTTIREELEYDPDVIEAQLAHKPSGSLGAAYDRAKFLKERHKMMQKWADYLDRLLMN